MSVWAERLGKNRWRVRWRNLVRIDPASGLPLGSKGGVIVTTPATRDELLTRVRRAIELNAFYIHAQSGPAAGCYGRAFQDWLAQRAANGASEGTRTVLLSAGRRICRDIRALEHLPSEAPIPVSLLSIDLATRLKAAWRAEGLSRWRIYDLSHHFLEAWRWAASQPSRYPHTPAPPLSEGLILPKPPPRVRGQEPTLAEVDAICRRAWETPGVLGPIVVTLRLTGLRVGQVTALKVEDVDLHRDTLTVSTGKSLKEKLERREIPLHPELREVLAAHIAGRSRGERLFCRPRGRSPTDPVASVRRLWMEATDAGECRRAVWEPDGRKPRPNHAFRAAFLTALRAAGVSDEVRKALVGHAEGTTEERHYSGVTIEQMRDGLNRLAGIKWGEQGRGSVTRFPSVQGSEKGTPRKLH